ncbi:MAG: nitric oxide synthase, partial [Christensenellaceae bacterium]|nr:nitric oxide synthase [Christensenellaceae bacterium]
MRVKVYYAGDKPCIQEVAIAISEELKSSSIPLPPSYPPENLALAFIGTQAKGKKPDQRAAEFIRMLDKKRVESAA